MGLPSSSGGIERERRGDHDPQNHIPDDGRTVAATSSFLSFSFRSLRNRHARRGAARIQGIIERASRKWDPWRATSQMCLGPDS
jgi:hypothetical protein